MNIDMSTMTPAQAKKMMAKLAEHIEEQEDDDPEPAASDRHLVKRLKAAYKIEDRRVRAAVVKHIDPPMPSILPEHLKWVSYGAGALLGAGAVTLAVVAVKAAFAGPEVVPTTGVET